MPGGDTLIQPDVDRMLGELWEEAEARLQVRAARAGILTPAKARGFDEVPVADTTAPLHP